MTHQSRLIVEDVPIGLNGGTWRRMRVRDEPFLLHKRGVLDTPQWLAVCRFRDDQDIAAGIRDADPLAPRCSRSGPPEPFSDAILDARKRLDGGWQAIQPDWLLFSWVVTNQGTLRSYEQDQRVRNGSATPLLVAAIERLARFYGSL